MTQQSRVSIEETQAAMNELVQPGKPNGKLAFWFACLSARTRLDRNCKQALVLRQYVDKPLPVNRDELKAQLGPCLGRTVNSLYEIERLWNTGIIHFNCGTSFELQSTWRDSMAVLIPGMGMKTVSFALHIYAPYDCKLLTIDCWHLRRMGVTKTTLRRNEYLACERLLYEHIQELAKVEPGYAPIVYAAYLWENTRRIYGASSCSDGYQSHAGLSCYV